ncbi:uncharacterized protein LOC135464938 [Liolophura sinensis]|uniref:uncharacterized protein LOC135464938 n=1 Tax=Liolophura sinensis TaxID=3198878 RepID=UPI003158D266
MFWVFLAVICTLVQDGNGECHTCHQLYSGVPSGFKRITYTESSEFLQNPRRGFWTELTTFTSHFHPLTLNELERLRSNSGLTVIQRIYVLDTFTSRLISDDFIHKIHADMETVRNGKMTVVLRFCYAFTSSPKAPYGDASKEWVLKHIHQLSPIFHQYVDIIDSIQAGFIGTWGEWYYTTYFGQPGERDYKKYPHTFGYSPQVIKDRGDVLKAVIDAAPVDIQVQQRYPSWNRMIYGPTPATRHDVTTHTYKGRTAFHNDCFLADKNDVGTYGDGVDVDYPYLHEQTKYLVAGGETCQLSVRDPSRHKCSTSLHDMAYFHWTFLNIGFYKPVLHDWQTHGCFNDIFRKLGYRLVLKESVFPTSVHVGSDFCFRIVMRNNGFAAPFRNWHVLLVMKKGSSFFEAHLPSFDMTLWLPGKDIILEHSIHVPSEMATGTYEMMLVFRDRRIPASSDYNILLANNNVPEHQAGINNLRHSVLMISGGHQTASSTCPHLVKWTPPNPSKYKRVVSQVHV